MEHCKLDRTCRRDGSAPPVGLIYTEPTLQGLEEILVSAYASRLSRSASDHCCRRSTHDAVNGRWIRPRQLAGLASLPDSMYKPLPALQVFLLPFGLDARPSFALLTVIYWITAAAGIGALVGWMSRFSLLLFAAGNTFLQAFAYSFGDLHHREALMIITLWLLALSPAGGVLSLDSYLASRNSPRRKTLRKRSIFAAWPLLLVQNLFGLVYLDAALRKLYAGGLDWVNGYTLQYYLYSDASRRGSAFGLWLARQHTAACVLSWVTILWEGTFFLVLIFPRLVWVYLPLGIGLHAGMALAGVASFPQFMALYVVFIPLLWNYGGRAVAMKWRAYREGLVTKTPARVGAA